MSQRGRGDRGRALDLDTMRREFDHGFAQVAGTARGELENLLLLRVAGGRYVVRGSEISGVSLAGKVSHVPSGTRALSGVAGIRGALVPVFSLSTLLGEPPAEGVPSWFLLVGRDEPLAFAFDGVVGYQRVGLGKESPVRPAAHASEYVREVVSWGTDVLSVVHLPSLVASLLAEAASARSRKEGE